MLSISKPLSAQRAAWYFKRDEYYLSHEGNWHGKLAEKLNLSGTIERDKFINLLNGFDGIGKKLVASAGAEDIKDKNGNVIKCGHRSGIDLTFSAPKSVSILSYYDNNINTSFEIALKKTLDHVENEFAHTQKKDRTGFVHPVKTDNLLWSIFRHDTSRELDPQLHFHCLLMNVTEDSSGKTKTVLNDSIYKNKLYIGQVFRNNLSLELQKIGYQVEVTDRKKGFFELKGVDENVLSTFSSRRKQVQKEMKRLRDLEFKDLPYTNLYEWAKERKQECSNDPNFDLIVKKEADKLSESTAKVYASYGDSELAAIAVTNRRRPKKDDVTREEITNRIEMTCQALHTSLQQIQQTAMNQEPALKSDHLLRDIICDAVTGITENQSTFSRYTVIKEALKMSIGLYSNDDLEREFDTMLSDGSISCIGQHEAKAGIKYIYSSKEMIAVERNVINICKELKGSTAIAIEKDSADKYIKEIDINLKFKTALQLNEKDPAKAEYKFKESLSNISSPEIRNKLIQLRCAVLKNDVIPDASEFPELHEYFDKIGYGFTPGQVDALKLITTTKDAASVIQGDAGTGKSFACLYAKRLLEDNGFVVRGHAPTGKATTGLANAAEIDEEKFSTLDSFLLKYHNTKPEDREKLFSKGKEVWLIDEAGMCGSRKYQDILNVAKKAQAKVVFIGDRKQFQSIDAGRMFSELQDKSGVDKVIMPDVIRQKTAQTKEIVRSISLKDMDFAFNVMQGFRKLPDSINKKDISNYSYGSILRFNNGFKYLSSSDDCKIIKIDDTSLKLEYFDEDKRRYINFDFTPEKSEPDSFDIFSPPDTHHPLSPFNIGDKIILSIGDQGLPSSTDLCIKEIAGTTLSVEYSDPQSGSIVIASFDPSKNTGNIEHLSLSGNDKRSGRHSYENMITVESDKDKCLNLVVNDYFNSIEAKKDVLLIAGTNKDKDNLNSLIRPELIKKGLVDSSQEFTVFQTRSYSGIDAMSADRYEKGQIIITNNSCGKIPKGTQAEIINCNLTDNTIRVNYWDKKLRRYSTKEIDVRKYSKNFNVYDQKKQEYGVGDLIIFLKNDRKVVGVNNGETAKIVSIDSKGNVKARLTSDEKCVSFNINNKGPKAYNFISHAYAITDYKSQGATTERLLWYAPTKNNVITSNAFYVAVTRCKEEVGVYTDNVEDLKSLVKRAQVKESTLDYSSIAITQPVDSLPDIDVSQKKVNSEQEDLTRRLQQHYAEYFGSLFTATAHIPKENNSLEKDSDTLNL